MADLPAGWARSDEGLIHLFRKNAVAALCGHGARPSPLPLAEPEYASKAPPVEERCPDCDALK